MLINVHFIHVEDGRLMADAETGEFWGFFGGFAPLPRKTAMQDVNKSSDSPSTKLLRYHATPSEIPIFLCSVHPCILTL